MPESETYQPHSNDNAPMGDSPPSTRSRANITTACLMCRQRKRKCMGGQPCPPCASSNSICCYEEGLDRRRKVYNEKARAEVDFQRRLLDGLLRAIKSNDCDRILNMVRANASMEELAAELGSTSTRNEYPNGRTFVAHAEHRLPPLSTPYGHQTSPTQPTMVLPPPSTANFREPHRHSVASSSGILPPFAELSASIPDSAWNDAPLRSSKPVNDLPSRPV